MAHLAAILFFGLIFTGAGVAAQMLVASYRREILAALKGAPPVRRAVPAPRIRVTVRPCPPVRRVPLAAAA